LKVELNVHKKDFNIRNELRKFYPDTSYNSGASFNYDIEPKYLFAGSESVTKSPNAEQYSISDVYLYPIDQMKEYVDPLNAINGYSYKTVNELRYLTIFYLGENNYLDS